MSTHRVEVVQLGPVTKHPNADTLGITPVWGYTAIVRLGDMKEGDVAIYVEPDYVVPGPEHPMGSLFAFLGDKRRIKAKRLRGTWSQGLLIPALPDMKPGDDVMERLGIVRYEPPLAFGPGGDSEKAHPSLAYLSKYDIESWRRYPELFEHGESVEVTEKLHGANGRYAWRDGRMWCGSRTMWKKEDPTSVWWRAFYANPWIEAFCQAHVDGVLYGEVFGQVQTLRYGAGPGQVFFRGFDLLLGNQWLDAPLFRDSLNTDQRVPLIYEGPYDAALMEELSRGDSKLASHLAEGIVVKPVKERTDPELGRVVLKLVSDRYLEKY